MIDLTDIVLNAAPPRVMDFGGTLTPALGGPRQRIDRLGTRHAFGFQTPNMKYEPDGRVWSTRLSLAKMSSALCWIPEPDLVLNQVEGAPVAAADVAGGSTLPITGATPGLLLPEGKWVSHIHDGRRYVYRVAAAIVVNGAGNCSPSIFPMLRTVISAGDVFEIAEPKVQGMLTETFEWPLDVEGFTHFNFTIEEDE